MWAVLDTWGMKHPAYSQSVWVRVVVACAGGGGTLLRGATKLPMRRAWNRADGLPSEFDIAMTIGLVLPFTELLMSAWIPTIVIVGNHASIKNCK